ncbi:uncharacterized protein LOC108228049 isoform X2 [Daucus carota subsp. sativus]|uniref:uncharacterized protein LOC108228049 isoform X2 n=1 Tax=Daucus carota subsp. sativus TaxID=79200 RepID=UPI0007EFBCB9|nr:PREDICTED: uncharacterized protein LOC108228049 isoform X2 [Daucus carota subsp. sativus]
MQRNTTLRRRMIGDYFCDDEVADGKGTYLQRNNGNMVLVFPWMIKLLMERALTWNVTMATWSLSSHAIILHGRLQGRKAFQHGPFFLYFADFILIFFY